MGEIMYAVFIGIWMMFLGVFMHVSLTREEQRYRNIINNKNKCLKKGD